MALADTITNLGNSIIALVGTRAKKDLSNIDEAGVEKIKSYAGGGSDVEAYTAEEVQTLWGSI